MNYFCYRGDILYCEELPVEEIVKRVGTPVYIYSRRTLERHFKEFDEPFKEISHLTCYSIKANSNIAIISIFAALGGGADIVSGGELYRALKAGVPPERIVFSGVGKSDEEIIDAIKKGILMFNVESLNEIEVIDNLAGRIKKIARIAVRVNPDVDPHTHSYITTGKSINKFGIELDRAVEIYSNTGKYKNLKFVGIDAHIGSQITLLTPFVETLKKLLDVIKKINSKNLDIKYIDIGGGLGITYDEEEAPHPREYASKIIETLKGWNGTLITEPGRVLTGNAGILVTRVLYRKENAGKNFVIVDAGMNDLIRPALYGAFQEILPVVKKDGTIKADVVGPVCESGDFFAKDRLVADVKRNDLLAIMSAGAYGFSMSSNYNSRRRPAEVLVDGERFFVIRKRDDYNDLIRGESLNFLKKRR
jgi:diaminopimelate decarboxylase